MCCSAGSVTAPRSGSVINFPDREKDARKISIHVFPPKVREASITVLNFEGQFWFVCRMALPAGLVPAASIMSLSMIVCLVQSVVRTPCLVKFLNLYRVLWMDSMSAFLPMDK